MRISKTVLVYIFCCIHTERDLQRDRFMHRKILFWKQGSVLGTTLYLIYTNDIGNLKHNGNIRLFADDSSIYQSSKNQTNNIELMAEDINRFAEYFRLNKLTVFWVYNFFSLLFCDLYLRVRV